MQGSAFTYARFIRLKKVMSIATATPSALLQLCAGGRTGARGRVSRAPLIIAARACVAAGYDSIGAPRASVHICMCIHIHILITYTYTYTYYTYTSAYYIYWLTSVHMLAQHSLAKSSGMSTAIAMSTGSLTTKRCTAERWRGARG